MLIRKPDSFISLFSIEEMKAANRSQKAEITFTDLIMNWLCSVCHCYECSAVESLFEMALQMIYMNAPSSLVSWLCCVIMIQAPCLICILPTTMSAFEASLLNFSVHFALRLVMQPQSCRTSLLLVIILIY